MADALARARTAVERTEHVAQRALDFFAVVLVVVALVFAAAAWSLGDTFFLRLGTEALILAGLAISVDILLGYVGMLSLGQALFFGLGAYTSALVLKNLAPSFWGALIVTLIVATTAGFIAGWIAIRARGVYFALITFGLAQVVSKVTYNTRELGASDGIIGIPIVQADFLLFKIDTGDAASFFLLVLALAMIVYLLGAYVMRTPFGRTLAAVRANEGRVAFLGFSPHRHKLAAFVIAADIAALFGALYPMLRGFVSPELMFFATSGNAVITVVVGGTGTLIGPIFGSVILTGLKSVVGTFTEHHLIVIGGLFILSVIFFPMGLVGYLRPPVERWLARRSQ